MARTSYLWALFLCFTALVAATWMVEPGPAHGRAGDLDRSFGGDGRVTALFEEGVLRVTGLGQQPNGRLVALGVLGNFETALVGYTAEGALDPSFGSGGMVTGPSGGLGLVVEPDGKLVTLGNALMRYLPDGTPDPSFGSGGEIPIRPLFIPFRFARQADGRLVVSGVVPGRNDQSKDRLALARFRPDGSLDESFGNGGRITTPIGIGQLRAGRPLVEPDGKVVVAAFLESSTEAPSKAVRVRYNADGSPDRPFGRQGDPAGAITRRPDGRFVIVSSEPNGGVLFMRLRANGSRDKRFGRNGRVLTAFGQPPRDVSADALLLDARGRMIVGGVGAPGRQDPDGWGIARFTPGGAIDRSFGRGGAVLTRFGGRTKPEWFSELLLQRDGRLVAAGSYDGTSYALARYHAERFSAVGRMAHAQRLAAGSEASVRVPLRCSQACSARLQLVRPKSAERGPDRRIVIGSARLERSDPGTTVARVPLDPDARRKLRRARASELELRVHFEASGRTAELTVRRLVLKRRGNPPRALPQPNATTVTVSTDDRG